MRMEQTISVSGLNTTDSGSITCSLAIDHLDYHSEPLTLLVSGQYILNNVIHKINNTFLNYLTAQYY